MNNYDLSVIIPARNEEFLSLTVENILANKRGNTEVIVILDGAWSNPPIKSHKDLTIIYTPTPWGQRGAANQGVRLSKAKWIMKIDAHCTLDEGFDVKLLKDAQDHQTILPALYNLHAFDWVCKKCNNRWYQSPTPTHCMNNGESRTINESCNSREFEKVIVFKPRLNKKSFHYRFDTTLHFQYHGKRNSHPDAQGHISETMSAQGSCFMLTRKKYWELEIGDENEAGKTGWGQQGTNLACKTWLSGGQLVTNKNTWYAHMFRTQGGDFGFPYKFEPGEQEKAREYSRNMWFNNAWDKQIYPLSWLLDKFDWPEDWSKPEGKEVKEMVIRKGEEFYTNGEHIGEIEGFDIPTRDGVKHSFSEVNAKNALDITGTELAEKISNLKKKLDEAEIPQDQNFYINGEKIVKRGIIYYTDNQIPHKFATRVRKNIAKAGLPIVSASLKPLDFGENIHMKGFTRGYEAYFNQILAALEASNADIIYLCEHDWLYHPSHFEFIPPRGDTFYYNWNWWRVRASDGLAVHYDTQLLPGLVAYRSILLDHYRSLVKYLEQVGFTAENANKVGFEPGTSKRIELGSSAKVERFDSALPIIDIRHGKNLTASKWKQSDFRSQKNCQGWIETTASQIPGWHFKDEDFLNSF